jgi:two-component system, sensor histidine kinase PdtaS
VPLCLCVFHIYAQSVRELHALTIEGTSEEQFLAYGKLANHYDYNQMDSALWASLGMVQAAHQLNTNNRLGEAYRTAGWYFANVGLLEQAVSYLYQAREFYENEGEQSLVDIALCYDFLAWTYIFLEEFDKPSQLFHLAMRTNPLRNRKDSLEQAGFFHSMGGLFYVYLEQFDSAEYYLVKAIDWRLRLGSRIESIARAQIELANAYILDKDFAACEGILKQINLYNEDSISNYVRIYELHVNGLIHHQRGEYAKAMALFEEVHKWMIQSGNQLGEIGLNSLRQWVETAEAGKYFEMAFKLSEILRQFERESVFKNRQRSAKALEIFYATAEKEKMIALQDQRISQRNQLLWILSSGIGLALVLAGFLYRSRQNAKRQSKKIETLMRELHHRVKNNLQVISSLLGLQSMKLEDELAKAAVTEGNQRIRAMSLIHQKLYHQDEVSVLDFQSYIKELVQGLAESFNIDPNESVVTEIPGISIDTDTALALGLIINELVTNSFKYTFTSIEQAKLELHLFAEGEKSYLLRIRDNGHGLPDGFDFHNAQSFGLRLVNILVSQLDAVLRIENKDGLTYLLQFQTR